MSDKNDLSLENVLTTEDVKKLLGLKSSQIDNLRRNKQLPFVDVARGSRVYFENDLIEWFKAHRKVLNQHD